MVVSTQPRRHSPHCLRLLAVIVYDASQPPPTRMEGEAAQKLMLCK